MRRIVGGAEKACAALVLGVLTGIGVGLDDGILTRAEVFKSIGAGLLTGVAVYRTENKP